jgi:hypothetical protein
VNRVARALLFALLLLGPTTLGCRSGTNRDELETLVERWRVLFNSHDLAGFTALYAPSGAYMTPGMVYFVRSPAELRLTLDALWRIHPDLRITQIFSIVPGGDMVAFAWEAAFTKAGKRQTLHGASFLSLEDDRIGQQLTVTSR